MIDYQTYCRIRLFHLERGLSFKQIAGELGIRPETVAKYAKLATFTRRRGTKRPSKLDAFKPAITRWLERHPYSATQIYQRLRADEGYSGGFSIVKDYVRAVRPVRHPAFLSLAFAPGEAAQVDWGCAGTIQIGTTRRRLSFFVMVLCHSRMAYVEFTCGEAMEHFLACHHNALEFFGGTPGVILIDNLKTGVLKHPFGEPAVFHPRYLDFAAHYGFEPRACNVRKANEKGRVENGVGYVKKNFLAGLDLPSSLVASHPRCYERHRDFENPDHVKDLIAQRHRARDAKWLMTFYALSPQAEYYHQQLTAGSLQARAHIHKIVALTDIYGPEKVALALEDAIASQAFSSQYIENILRQRERHTPTPGPLHLTRRADLLEIQLPAADLSLYDRT